MQHISEHNDICELVRDMETTFTSGTGTQTSKYVTSDLYDDINKIYAYLESKHWSGLTDSLGREKPFFNICIADRNIWYRATDIDRKHINVKPTKSTDTTAALLATVHLKHWMRKENFGMFLNLIGIEMAGFNSAVSKAIEENGKLHCMVIPWSRLIVDQVNFDANPKIEILELTEAELYQREGYDPDQVEKLCGALKARELTDGTHKDHKNKYIKLYEVHMNGKLSYITGKDEDKDTYVQQMHVVSFVATKEQGRFDDFTLFKGREAQDPYMLWSLLPSTDGSISLMGAVKSLFESQWMVNDSAKKIKDQLDITSKRVFQTSDGRFADKNILTAMEVGDVYIHNINEPITAVAMDTSDLIVERNNIEMWKGLGNQINGISDAMAGANAPSGTAWRQVEALLQESHSLFELMTENKALDLEKFIRKYVIPHLKKQMDTTDEIAGTLEAHNISQIDSIYIPREAVRRHNNQILTAFEQDQDPNFATEGLTAEQNTQNLQSQIKNDMGAMGNQRFFKPSDISTKTWKEAIKDLEWELEIDITGEQTDKQLILTTLNTTLSVIANPQFANDPKARLIVDKILTTTGAISPLELSTLPQTPPAPATVPGQPPMNIPDLATNVQGNV